MLFTYLSLFFISFSCQMTQVRTDFHQLTSEDALVQFMDNYKNCSTPNAVPYIASAIMQQAEYTAWAHKKFGYFTEGRDSLERYITENPKDIDGRYVRLLVQSELPFFLGYRSELQSDIAFLENNLPNAPISGKEKDLMLENVRKIKMKQ